MSRRAVDLTLAAASVVLGCALASVPAHAESLGDLAQPALANPASVNCAAKGGSSEIHDAAGGQTGYCRLRDNQVCEEWALLRDERCIPPPAEKRAPS
ncbi:DUF333 domain-containing protein [Methylobacterium durans]|uniref:putative hemolysin n=1 Tax=Methylobacterium durans TaxID=2202825 RepID=UPI002AFF11C0|nr:DUF333 domain-containing protein [Methylobacterium durans]MEA1832555.1 DUF333 domain-containing protein [Methylobacterium durans]